MSMSSGNMAGASETLLEILSNPASMKRELKKLEEARVSAQKAIDLAGPADEVVNLRDRLGKELEAEEEKVRQIRREINEVVESSANTSAKIIKDAEVSAEDIIKSAEETRSIAVKMEVSAREKLSEAQAEADDVEEGKKAILKREDSLNQREEELTELKTKLLQEKSKLATVRETIDQLLE